MRHLNGGQLLYGTLASRKELITILFFTSGCTGTIGEAILLMEGETENLKSLFPFEQCEKKQITCLFGVT